MNSVLFLEESLMSRGCEKIAKSKFSLSIFPDITWTLDIFKSNLVEAELFFDVKTKEYSNLVKKVYNNLIGELPHHSLIRKISAYDGFYRRSITRINTRSFPILEIEESRDRAEFQIREFDSAFLDLVGNISSMEVYFRTILGDELPFEWVESNSIGRAVEVFTIQSRDKALSDFNPDFVERKIEWDRFGMYPDEGFDLRKFVIGHVAEK